MALWQNLKSKKLFGFRFLRQHLIVYQVVGQECYYYVADFYCNRARLVVELDGGINDKKEQREKDYNRDQIINSLGLSVLRIQNEELFNMPAVLEKKTNPARASRSIKYNNLAGAPPLPFLGRGRGGYNFDQRQEPARNVCDQTFPTGCEVLP